MKDFRFIQEIIDFVSTINDQNNEVQVVSMDNLENEFSRLKATYRIKDFEAHLYNIPLERFTLFKLNDSNVVAIHLFVKPNKNLIGLIEADLGDYHTAASWGIEEKADLKIVSWNYGRFIVDLRKNVKNLDRDYTFMPPYDVITISNDVYRKLK
ncbi:hypothetical protein [Spirosoma aerophilum]